MADEDWDADGDADGHAGTDAGPAWRWRRVRRVSAKGFTNLEAWRVRAREDG